MNKAILAKLKFLAEKEVWSDDEDFVVYDFSDSNVDDAFYGGHRAGQTDLARELLNILGVSYGHIQDG